MPAISEIIDAKNAVIAILDQKIADAIGLKNAGASGMDDIVHTLMEQRQAVLVEAANAALLLPN